ncbi:MAG: DedA family protein [Hyphomonadaceae bacterium]|nr:DedA family protein [Hyphomonadaceae bacterium]
MTQWIIDLIAEAGYWGVFALMVLENLVPPIPSELIMPLAGYAVAEGRLALAPTLAAGVAGSLVGALPWYYLARWLGRARFARLIAKAGPWLALEDKDLQRAGRWFARRGWAAVLFARLVPGLRTLISAPAGLFAMPMTLFLALTALGSLAWVSVLTGAGFLLEAHYHRIGVWLDPIAAAVFMCLSAAYVIRVLSLLRRARSAPQPIE